MTDKQMTKLLSALLAVPALILIGMFVLAVIGWIMRVHA